MEIKSIKTVKDYNQALERVEIMFDAKNGTSERDKIDLYTYQIAKPKYSSIFQNSQS